MRELSIDSLIEICSRPIVQAKGTCYMGRVLIYAIITRRCFLHLRRLDWKGADYVLILGMVKNMLYGEQIKKHTEWGYDFMRSNKAKPKIESVGGRL